ncbi:hypothetical protein GF339_15895 [candidate division KSB3 bacterium]|uniref:Carbohydrate kinase PfkB domain-containing protein n=1 Tax=candidate division KSB3 bacterium TaxID=2044937 RepID=A0A9D5Q750_9BACT|nr:hypothetical protein [candidate division KSB3 bacterium]MBD3326068.1 hypothetical protein [candidate division KSB3 bacterium]
MANILGIGGICVDRLMIVPRIPDWDELEYISEYTMQQGGMVATATVAAARLGEQVEFIGGIGNDDGGRYHLEVLQAARVNTDRMRIFDGAHTAFSFVLVHEVSGKRTIIHYRGVQGKPDLGIGEIDLAGVQFLHLDGYWLEDALKTAQRAKSRGITITLDPSSKLLRDANAADLFRLVDYFMPSYTFARRLTGETDPALAAEQLLHYGGKAVIITKGEEGCFISTRDHYEHLPAFEVPVVDTTGAGDVFHGAFVAGLSKGYDLRQAAQFASAVAALKCTVLGGQSGIPTFQHTQAFLGERGIAF